MEEEENRKKKEEKKRKVDDSSAIVEIPAKSRKGSKTVNNPSRNTRALSKRGK